MGKHLDPGSRLKGYRIVDTLGSGAEGTAYLATTSKGEDVVLKQHAYSASDPARIKETERVRRAGRLIGKRNSHVCAILELFVHDDLLYVVMEHVEGDGLDVVLEIRGRLALTAYLTILHDVLMGLEWLHSLDIVHRDVKPANIIVDVDGKGRYRAKLIDLCLALHLPLPRLTHKGGLLCTPEYAAPELLLGGDAKIDGRADLYSLGVVTFEALTGRLPFAEARGEALFKRILDPKRPSARDLVPDIALEFDEYIQRLMALRPDNRPASARQAWDECVAILSTSAGKTPAPVASPSSGPDLTMPAVVPAPLPRPFPASSSPCLVVASGRLNGTAIPVPPDGVTLGRNLLNPDDPLISRFHCRATAGLWGGIVLRDLGSCNGLITGTRRVRKVRLEPGDTVRVGATVLKHG